MRAARKSKAKRMAQKRDRATTRAALIAAGEKLFAELSFEGATYDAIAAESGVNKALIAYHFGSKEGFYDAVVSAAVSEAIAEIAGALDEGRDPVGNFRAYIRTLATVFWRRPSLPAIIMREYLGGKMQERAAPFEAVLQFYRTTERLYESGRKAGLFRKVDPHALHLCIVGPLIHFVIAAGMRRRAIPKFAPDVGDPSIEAFGRSLEKMVLDGVRRA